MDPLSISSLASELGIPFWVLVIVLIWSAIWKALALWKSARLKSPIWFIILFVVNTMGILEILYIFLFSKINLGSAQTQKPKSKKKRKNKREK